MVVIRCRTISYGVLISLSFNCEWNAFLDGNTEMKGIRRDREPSELKLMGKAFIVCTCTVISIVVNHGTPAPLLLDEWTIGVRIYYRADHDT